MDKIAVVYVVNGATKQDVLTGTEVSIQREYGSVHVTFPNSDGTYLVQFSKKVNDLNRRRKWVSYADCAKIQTMEINSDTPTEVS